MDRDRAREGLVRALLDDRSTAARIRGVLDSSQFGDHAALVMLVADHDLHDPDAPASGIERRESVHQHIQGLLDALTRHELRAGGRRPAADPRWILATEASASLSSLYGADAEPAPVHELLEAFDERRRGGTRPEVPGPAGVSRRRRRGDAWPA